MTDIGKLAIKALIKVMNMIAAILLTALCYRSAGDCVGRSATLANETPLHTTHPSYLYKQTSYYAEQKRKNDVLKAST